MVSEQVSSEEVKSSSSEMPKQRKREAKAGHKVTKTQSAKKDIPDPSSRSLNDFVKFDPHRHELQANNKDYFKCPKIDVYVNETKSTVFANLDQL